MYRSTMRFHFGYLNLLESSRLEFMLCRFGFIWMFCGNNCSDSHKLRSWANRKQSKDLLLLPTVFIVLVLELSASALEREAITMLLTALSLLFSIERRYFFAYFVLSSLIFRPISTYVSILQSLHCMEGRFDATIPLLILCSEDNAIFYFYVWGWNLKGKSLSKVNITVTWITKLMQLGVMRSHAYSAQARLK